MKYPTDIVLDNGWARIHKGHNLDRAMLQADLDHHQGPPRDGQELHTEEIHYGYLPRVKWCSRSGDGWGCDQEGEWHSHWYLARPNDDNAFTIAYWQRTPAASCPKP